MTQFSQLTACYVTTDRHRTSYLEAGPADGVPVVLVHGWPHLAIMWREQAAALAARGFRVIAPDLRGCGSSTVHKSLEAYAQREIVRDMIELADALRIERAVWMGHDWGAIVVSNLARHHPDCCLAVGGISQPFNTLEQGATALIPLINRSIYPAERFPYGQFEYMPFYHEQFAHAQRGFEGDLSATFRALMRSGVSAEEGKPFMSAFVRQNGGWFGPDGQSAPDLPLDTSVMSEVDLEAYVEAYRKTGFFGIDAFYMNDAANGVYYAQAPAQLELPVLFITGQSDYVCDTEHSDLARPMRERCADLTYVVLEAGHWLPQEAPEACSSAILAWLSDKVRPGYEEAGIS
jgi:soluble epoxide hydrolase/lipid-phosphate phosphatase